MHKCEMSSPITGIFKCSLASSQPTDNREVWVKTVHLSDVMIYFNKPVARVFMT